MKYIVSRSNETPAEYAAYLSGQANWARNILAMPDVQWARGSSHVIAQATLHEVESARIDLATEHGRWNASGQLVGFE